jgi:hypothetical protein
LLISILLPTLALASSALAQTGLADGDRIFYSLVHTRASGMAKPAEAPVLCLVGQKPDGSSQGFVRAKAPRAASEGPCDFLRFVSPHIETVRDFSNEGMKAAFWNKSEGNPAPEQYTLDSELSGREFNEAFNRLKGRCPEDECQYFNLFLVRNGAGQAYRLPLKNLKVSPAAKFVSYDPRDSSFEIDNHSVRVITR